MTLVNPIHWTIGLVGAAGLLGSTAHAQVDPLPGIKEAGSALDADSALEVRTPASQLPAGTPAAQAEVGYREVGDPKKSTDPELRDPKTGDPATSADPSGSWQAPPSQKPPNPLLSSPLANQPGSPSADPAAMGPELAEPVDTPESLAKVLEITADQQGFDQLIQRFVATGNVKAVLAGGRLMAERLEYDTTNRTVYASGSVRFRRGNQYFQASRLRFSLIEATGEMEDVYGVLDLSTSEVDLNPELPVSTPLPDPEPIACPTILPPVPDWHPHPWAATLWGGQLFDANFGDTFKFKGQLREELLLGAGLQRRLIKAGPFALELDFTALGHWAAAQRGSGFTSRFTNDASGQRTAAQSFGEFTAGIGLRAWLQPWLNVGVVQGVSVTTSLSNFEDTFRERSSRILNYLGFEVEGSFSPQWSVVGRIHHRSGAFGTFNGVKEGSNAYLLGLRYRFGEDATPKAALQAAASMPPAKGCPNRPEEPPERPRSLPEALEQAAMGGGAPKLFPEAGAEPRSQAPETTQGPLPAPKKPSFLNLRQQERERDEAIATIEQRISNVQAREGLVLNRQFSVPGGTDLTEGEQNSNFGPATPPQVRRLRSNRQQGLVQGTLTRLRFQSPRIQMTNTDWRANRVSFSNDPFTPAQVWMDAENVVAVQEENGDTVIRANRNRLIFEDRLSVPVASSTRIQQEQEVENRWVFGFDEEDRDGFFVGRRLRPIGIGSTGTLQLEPQFLLERAVQGTTNSYPLPGTSAGSSSVEQDAQLGDLFGLEAQLNLPLLGFDAEFNLDLSSFNPENIANGTRSWGEMSRPLKLPLLGDTVARLFAAYRFRIWNGSLGEQDVYSAFGGSLEQQGVLPNLGRLRNSYFWRLGVGNYQSNEFINGNESDNFAQLWRANAFGAINSSLNIWRGQTLPLTPDGALRYSPVPIVPGLTFNTNLSADLAYFGDGTNQNVLSFSGGPTLTLGNFSKPYFDFTQITLTGGIAVRDGLSPFGFDQAVDLGTVGVGLTQQLAGPLLFNGGIGLNVDPSSPNYGELTGSFVELRWQRRAYALSVFYSPFEGIGGVRVRLNDFGFNGTGVPFVPFRPVVPGQPRGRWF